jgi:hypothetical protein
MRFRQLIAAAALLIIPTTAYSATIEGDNADQFVAGPVDSEPQDANGTSLGNPGGFTLKIGTVGPFDAATSGRVPVFVFQLPDLGATADPFLTATLSFGIGAKNANTTVNTDLYGLARRDAAPGVLTTDYYLGDLDTTDATLLQDDILTPDVVANTIVTTDVTGSANLLTFLNAQYAAGTGAGLYIYLRLNVDGPMTNVTGYNTHTANDTATEKNPLITYTTSVVTEDADFDADGDVDGADFLAWQENNGTATGATLAQGDANADGAVNNNDLTAWRTQFGTPATQVIPEPTTLASALLALGSLALSTRRRSS